MTRIAQTTDAFWRQISMGTPIRTSETEREGPSIRPAEGRTVATCTGKSRRVPFFNHSRRTKLSVVRYRSEEQPGTFTQARKAHLLFRVFRGSLLFGCA